MGLFGNTSKSNRGEHSVKITQSAIEVVRAVTVRQRIANEQIALYVARAAHGRFVLEITDPTKISRSDHAASRFEGILILIPRADVEALHDLVIDFADGSFRLNGSAVPRAIASDPGGVKLSQSKLFALAPQLEFNFDVTDNIASQLWDGDSRAAVVLKVAPLLIAAYTSELDDVALLWFPDELVELYRLKPGLKMLTVNGYFSDGTPATDMVPGPLQGGRWVNFRPFIAEFLAENTERVAERKRAISDDEYRRALNLGKVAYARAQGRYRDGRPPDTWRPAF